MRSLTRATAPLLAAGLALGACLALAACGKKPAGPSREELLAQLRLAAASLKIEGEKVDPRLPVESKWELAAADVQEQPGNELFPYRGTVRFKIVARTKEVDGTVTTDQFEKSFGYVYDAAQKKWR